MNSKNLTLLVLVLAGLGLGAGLFLLEGENGTEHVVEPIDRTAENRKELEDTGWSHTNRDPDQVTAKLAEPKRTTGNESTVAWPLEIRLEMLESSTSPQREGVPAKGTGANAHLAGLIRGAGEQGLPSTITFIGGANAERVLHSDSNGSFGAHDLYPGLALARVSGGQHVAVREISLRQGREAQLNVSFHRTTSLVGEVIDRDGKPIAGATVSMDGQVTTTDLEGVFRYPRMTPGRVYVQVDKPGFASYRENLPIAGGKTIEQGTIKFTLEKGASLRINVLERVGSRGDALLYFLPATARGRDRRFPWHEHNPTRVLPGGTVLIEDLPAERVNLWLFHTGAKATPAATAVRLRPGVETTKTLHLEPAPQIKGVVRRDGAPVARARVSCEVPDRVSTTMSAFGEGPGFFDIALLPEFPVANQVVYTNDQGEFAVTAWTERSTAKYITATSNDGLYSACEVIKSDQLKLELNLQPIDEGDSRVEIDLPERFQGLPVKIWVNGAPREPFTLHRDKDLVVSGLNDGVWAFASRWNSERLQEVSRFDLTGKYRVAVHLPEGAIVGQTDDVLKRVRGQ